MFSTVWNTQRFRELGREEKEEGAGRRDRGDLVEKKESPNQERAVKAVICSQVKIGNEDWFLKCSKLITNTKKQKIKIQSKGWIFKNIILKKRKKVT